MFINKVPLAFDHIFYSMNYKDLNKFFNYNKVGLKNHYLDYGQFENRKYCGVPDNFNWEKYIEYVNYDPTEYGNKYLQDKHDALYSYVSVGKNKLLELEIHDNFFYDEETYNSLKKDEEIYIVYFAYLNPLKNWRHIVYGQITDLVESQILTKSKLFVVLSGTQENMDEAKRDIDYMVKKDVVYKELLYNNFEFDALEFLRELTINNEDKIFIYFHSKGMVNNNKSENRLEIEIKLTRNLIGDWENTLYKFKKNKFINKAGAIPAIDGYVWFNFWWARGSYLSKLGPLINANKLRETNGDSLVIPDDDKRYDCEIWLGNNKKNSWYDCYSLIEKKITYVEQRYAPDTVFKKTPNAVKKTILLDKNI